MAREHDAYMTGLWVAQEARKREGWTTNVAKTAAAVDTGVAQPEPCHGRHEVAGSSPAPRSNLNAPAVDAHQRTKADAACHPSESPFLVPATSNASAASSPPSTRDRSLVGACQQEPGLLSRKTPAPLERDVLKAVLAALRAHPRVAFVERINSGAYKSAAGHYVRFGFVGCPDILGMLKDGRFLAIEVKRPGGNPTGDQVEFLGVVARWHGVAFVAWSADDVARALA